MEKKWKYNIDGSKSYAEEENEYMFRPDGSRIYFKNKVKEYNQDGTRKKGVEECSEENKEK